MNPDGYVTQSMTFLDNDSYMGIGTQDSHVNYQLSGLGESQLARGQAYHEITDGESLSSVVQSVQNLNIQEESRRPAVLRDQIPEWNLPEWKCSYCDFHDPKCVVKCNTCNKWFCNGLGRLRSSHIVHHLVKAKHRDISLHPKGPVPDTVLECYCCGVKNIFVLGFVPAQSDSVVILMCRQPCSLKSNMKELNWDPNQWQPLISSECLLDWLVHKPAQQDMLMKAKRIDMKDITRLETEWKEGAQKLAETAENGAEWLRPVQQRYEDGFEYQNIMGPLIHEEEEYEKQLKIAQVDTQVKLFFVTGLNKKVCAKFFLPSTDSELRLMKGDHVTLQYKEFSAEGQVTKIPDSSGDDFLVQLKIKSDKVPKTNDKFDISLSWKGFTFRRMQEAVKSMARDKTVSKFIHSRLMGHIGEEVVFKNHSALKSVHAPNLPILNKSQQSAVRHALQQPLSLIQGPPGTGKTVVSASLVYQLVKVTEKCVLVCAPSNTAVDQLTEKINKTGLKVVRLFARSREELDSSVSFLSLNNQILKNPYNDELQRLEQLKEEMRGELSASDEKRYLKLWKVAQSTVLNAADVICCTCVCAGDSRLRELSSARKFQTVLIDEAMQATEPECMVPIVLGCQRLILVGDHCQLGPVVMCKKAASAGLSQSLFERLVVTGIKPFRLTVQYRMHPDLAEFPSSFFYEGSLQNGVSEADRILRINQFPWPNKDSPMFFYAIAGQEELAGSGTSYLNRAEACMAEQIVTRMITGGVRPENIGVITPYEGQRAYMCNFMQLQGTLNKTLYKQVEIASVDAFQGREKDLIIMTCVRSNEHQGIGFLSDPRRLNVALTRARYGLIVIGNPKLLCKEPLWNHLLCHFRERRLLVQGPLSNLKESMMAFPPPTRMMNLANPGSHFMMRDAPNRNHAPRRPALPGSRGSTPTPPPAHHFFRGATVEQGSRGHQFSALDAIPLSGVAPPKLPGFPLPMNMFLNMNSAAHALPEPPRATRPKRLKEGTGRGKRAGLSQGLTQVDTDSLGMSQGYGQSQGIGMSQNVGMPRAMGSQPGMMFQDMGFQAQGLSQDVGMRRGMQDMGLTPGMMSQGMQMSQGIDFTEEYPMSQPRQPY